MIKNFPVSSAPHLGTPDSASRITWRFVLALVPVWLVLMIQAPLETGYKLVLVLLSSLLMETLCAFWTQRKVDFKEGSTVLWSLLLSIVLPNGAGPAMIFSSSAVSVFLGKEFFGGRTGVWAHPAWLGYAFFALAFPGVSFSPMGYWNPFSGFWPALITLALLSGGVFLMIKRNSSWEAPLLYLGLIVAASQLLEMRTVFSLPAVLLSAFWVLPEPAASACTKRGKIGSALAAALVTVMLDFLGAPAAPIFGILFLNLVTPWMDEWILPRRISFEAQVPETRNPK